MGIFPPPPHRHDPNQASLERAVDKIQDHLDAEGFTDAGMISMRGFPAAYVNLGWLREHIVRGYYEYAFHFRMPR